MPNKGTICLISVSGLPTQLRPAAYKLSVGSSYSKLASIPLLYEKMLKNPDAKFKFILLVPHSLLTYPEDAREYLLERDLKAATEALVRSIKEELLLGSLEHFKECLEKTGRDNGEINRLEDVVNSADIRVVQSRGAFPLPHPDRTLVVSFSGDPLHTFVEAFHALLDIYEETDGSIGVAVDLSHGWNAYTTLAYLGSSAFFDIFLSPSDPKGSVGVYSSEPYSTATRTLQTGKARSQTKLVSEGTSLGLLDMSDVSKMHSLASTLGSVARMVYERMSPRDMLGIVESLVSGSDPLTFEVARLLFQMRKLSCALNTGIVPYIHQTLVDLRELLLETSLPEKYGELRGELRRGEFLDGEVQKSKRIGDNKERVEWDYQVRYSRKPPLSLVILSSAFSVLSTLGFNVPIKGLKARGDILSPSLKSPCGEVRRGYMHLSLVDSLRGYYQEMMMYTNAVLLEAEFSLVDIKTRRSRSAIEALNDYMKSEEADGWGTVTKYLSNFIDAALERRDHGEDIHTILKEHALVDERGSCIEGLPSPLYSKYTLRYRRGKGGPLGTLHLKTSEELWKDIEFMCSQNPSGSWELNLCITWSLVTGSSFEFGSEEIRNFLRNLMAHAGVQHYSVATIICDPEEPLRDVFLVYYSDVFDKLDEIGGEKVLSQLQRSGYSPILEIIGEKLGDIRKALGCLCDIY